MSPLNAIWTATWQSLHLSPPAEPVYAQLLQAYAEDQRAYHTGQHLQECLNWWPAIQQDAEHPGEVALALWFHDAVYQPQASGNEAASAAWAVQVLRGQGADADVITRVEAHIMATCHSGVAHTTDQQLVVDIDLAILGAAEHRYAEFERQVRQEYLWVPEALFRSTRSKILRSFLERPHIYSGSRFRQALEARARSNLHDAIAALG